MSNIRKKERETQNRVVALFQKELKYRHLGHWEVREENSNIEEEILADYLTKKGYSPNLLRNTIQHADFVSI